MKRPADAARLLRESNPVADDAFAGAAGDGLGRATFERIIDLSAEPAQATGRSPRRRRAFWLAAVAAAVAAIAVAAVVVPGALLNGAGGPVAYAANVVKGVNSALSEADAGTFAQMTVTTTVEIPGVRTTTSTAEEWSYGDRWRSVTNSPAGHPVYDEGFSASRYTLVSYPRRTWARQPGLGRPAKPPLGTHGCGQVSATGPLLFQPSLPGTGVSAKSGPARPFSARSLLTVARTLHAAVSCGTLDVAGRQRIDGIMAIKLTSGRNSPIAETIWVSPGSYLPVRVVIRSSPGHSLNLGNEIVLRQAADFTWLPPTPQNLAKLTVPIPAGFRRVTFGQAAWPIRQQMPQGLLPVGASVPSPGYAGHPGKLRLRYRRGPAPK
jgi:hypothetical protein